MRQITSRSSLRAAAAAVALLAAVAAGPPAEAAGVKYWSDEGAAFLKGTHEGTALTAQRWLALAGERTVLLEPSPTRFVWDLALDSRGTLYIATGNRGKLLRLRRRTQAGAESVEEFYDFTDPVIFSLATDGEDNLYAATSPGGVVYKLVPQPQGKPRVSVLYDTDGEYVWDMVVDRRGQLYLATGPQGHIYRVDPDGKATLLYDSPDPHVLSLALGPDDTLYAGTNEHGWVYRFLPDGSLQVAYDAAEGEIHTMVTDAQGNLYFGTADLGREARPAEQARAAQAVVSELMRGRDGGGQPSLLAPPSVKLPGEKVQATNALYRLTPSGEVLQVGRFKGVLLLSMARAGERTFVGTGNEGRLFLVDAAGRLTEMEPRKSDKTAPPRPRQVTALAVLPGEPRARVFLGTANPGGLLALEPGFTLAGTYTSRVLDARFPARWGRLSIEGEFGQAAGAQVRTRSGHTQKPDETWSDWQDWQDVKPGAAGGDGAAVASPPARFLQYQLRLSTTDPTHTPTVTLVRLAYLTSNQRPRIEALSVGRPLQPGRPAAPPSGPPQGSAQGGPPGPRRPSNSSRQGRPQRGLIPVYWRVSDPNGDKLTYSLYFRGEGETRWKLVAEKVSANNYSWQTEAVPDGTYYVKLVASDAPANPGPRTLSAEQISTAFLVDNTPPRVSDLGCERLADTYTLSATVADETSPITALAYSIDAGEWQAVEPADGIFDERTEEVSVDIGELEPGEHTITLRATDSRGNTAAAKQVLVVPGREAPE